MQKPETSKNVLDFHQYSRNFTKEQLRELKNTAVDYYTSAGYRLFPLKGKVPALKGKSWQETPFDPLLEGDDFKGNYGVILKNDDLVIDVDPKDIAKLKNGKLVKQWSDEPLKEKWQHLSPLDLGLTEEGQIDDPLKRLMSGLNLPKYPNTYIVKSGSGGFHIHFKVPPGQRWAYYLENYPGIDIRGVGTYLVGPGSMHDVFASRAYYIRRGSPEEIQPLPLELIETLRKSTVLTNLGLSGFSDDVGTQERYTRWLKYCDPAIQGNYGGHWTHAVILLGRDYGLSPETTFDLMLEHFNPRCEPEWEEDELRGRVQSAYRNAKDAIGNQSPKADFAELDVEDGVKDDPLRAWEIDNLRWNFRAPTLLKESDLGNTLGYFLEPYDATGLPNPLYRLFRYNQLKEDIEFTRVPPWSFSRETPAWGRAQEAHLKAYISQQKHYVTNNTLVNEAVDLLAYQYAYHPVREYLQALEWDGVGRLDTFLARYAGAEDTPLNREIGKNTLIAAVYRAMEPGCKMNNVLVLEGEQQTNKSELVAILGGDFSRVIEIDVRDEAKTVQKMLGGWILEAPEMVFVRKHDANAVKAIVTTRVDSVRLPYERRVQDYKRSSIIIGTCNPTEGQGYFNDPTGNARYWPVLTTFIDIVALRQDRDQLLAEAVARYRAREQYWITDTELLEILSGEQLLRQKQSILQHRVFALMMDEEIRETVELTWILRRLEIRDHDTSGTLATEISAAMRLAGYRRKRGSGFAFELINPLGGLL